MREAPLGLMEGRRRPLRPWHVLVTIEDMLVLTWDVPTAVLQKHLPPGLVAVSGDGVSRVSALTFRNRGLRPAFPGFPRLSCAQMNLRSYVLHPETGAEGTVFFHGLFLGSPLLARFSAWSFGVPFRPLPLHVRAERGPDGVVSWEATSGDDSVGIRAREQEAAGAPDPAMLDALTNPHTGIVGSRGGRGFRTWSIWHRPQALRTMKVEACRIRPLEELALGELTNPRALLVDSIDYEVHLPAKSVRLPHPA